MDTARTYESTTRWRWGKFRERYRERQFYRICYLQFKKKHKVGVVNGYLYAMGGHDYPASNPSALRTDSVERYDPGTDTWTLVKCFLYS